ncbi:MAG: MATE family efflux transporter [Rhodospirillales bacterium]|nr:MATE family efflux transporter [Rhodospirillales bacterium]
MAGPIILANLGQPLMGMVDTTLSGHLEDPALIGSVAVGALIFSFLFWSFSFLRQATGGLTAQARGAADWTEVRAVLWRALLFALVLGVLLWALQDPAEWLALTLIGASQTVTEGAALYFSLRIWSAPATLTFYCLHGWLLGMQDTRSVMLLTLSLQGLNAGFSCLFVLVCDWGLAGVAVGTLLAEYLAVGLGWLLVRRHLQRHPAGPSATGLLEGRKLRALVLVNANLMVRTFALLFGIGIFTGTAAQFGDRTLAANNLLQQLFSLVAFALDGFADAAEAMVGYAKGVRNRLLASRTIVAALQMAALFSLPFSLTYGLFGAEILHLFTKHDEVAVTAETYLVWVIVLPLAGVWAFVFDGTFIGAMRTAALRNAMLVSLASFWGLQSLLVPLWGNHGLWLAFVGFILMRGIALAVALPRLLNAIDPRA